jgi:hypothetical protein
MFSIINRRLRKHSELSKRIEPTEVEWEDGARQIDDCEYLLVKEIRAAEDLTLSLLLSEAKPQAPILEPRNDSEWEKLCVGGKPIEEDATCRNFQLIFEKNSMVAYMVLNESYGKYPQSPEEFTGRNLRFFSRSHLLEFTQKTTIACDEYPGALQHYQIATLNHVIDVITTKPPRIAIGLPSAF